MKLQTPLLTCGRSFQTTRARGCPACRRLRAALVGYFSYDYLGYSEPSVRRSVTDRENFKDVDLMLFDKVIAFDNVRQKIILIVNMPLSDAEVGYNKAVMELKQLAQLLKAGEKKAGTRRAPLWGNETVV